MICWNQLEDIAISAESNEGFQSALQSYLGPSINGLVTEGGFVLALLFFQIDSEHTQDYTKLFPVCNVEILQVTVNQIKVLSSF